MARVSPFHSVFEPTETPSHAHLSLQRRLFPGPRHPRARARGRHRNPSHLPGVRSAEPQRAEPLHLTGNLSVVPIHQREWLPALVNQVPRNRGEALMATRLSDDFRHRRHDGKATAAWVNQRTGRQTSKLRKRTDGRLLRSAGNDARGAAQRARRSCDGHGAE